MKNCRVHPTHWLISTQNIAIFLPVTVLNMERTMFREKRDFWYSFIWTCVARTPSRTASTLV